MAATTCAYASAATAAAATEARLSSRLGTSWPAASPSTSFLCFSHSQPVAAASASIVSSAAAVSVTRVASGVAAGVPSSRSSTSLLSSSSSSSPSLSSFRECARNGGRWRNPAAAAAIVVFAAATSDLLPEGDARSRTDEQWLALLPDKAAALYCCSLPGIEAWLRSLGFEQSSLAREQWAIERDTWQAELTMDVTDLSVRYIPKGAGPGALRAVERRFSYALSREDLENAILAGP